ncbi:MAG: tRNA 2-thiocytidine biosynthesis protein TtcA [Gammaproteobacteria bacterium]|nr:tRNA 2-thiocytidine biosynthesis protein TtcA [Gammaproteobacteria bacterium]
MKTKLRLPKPLLHLTGRAIMDFDMIGKGDRIMLGLSGGKDSLTLLHLLLHFQRHAPIDFELGVVTIDPQADGFDPSALIPYVKSMGLKHHYRQEPILELAQTHMKKNSYCAFCARMKRGLMYDTLRKHDYNVLALAQHLDDLAESFLMSAFHQGQLNTMKAHYLIDAGDLRVIRPMVYVRERQILDFAANGALPVIEESCPACFSIPTQRAYMKSMLDREERANPQIFKSLLSAMRPLMKKGMPET